MTWRTAQTVDGLKELGTFTKVKAQVKREIEATTLASGLKLACTPRGWPQLLAVIQKFITIEAALGSATDSGANGDQFFKSDDARFIFALVEMEGAQRNRLLGIDDEHYQSKAAAKAWRNQISQKIHPDRNHTHPLADQATSKLNEIYELLVE